jgi:hypothetical protein
MNYQLSCTVRPKNINIYYKLMKQKILNFLGSHPKVSALAIGAAITVAIGIAIGAATTHEVFATGGTCTNCHYY